MNQGKIYLAFDSVGSDLDSNVPSMSMQRVFLIYVAMWDESQSQSKTEP